MRPGGTKKENLTANYDKKKKVKTQTSRQHLRKSGQIIDH